MRDEYRDVWVMLWYFGGITLVWCSVRAWRANRNKVWPMRHYNKEDK